MCNVHNLLAYCCELFDYDRTCLALYVDLFGLEEAKKSEYVTRLLMYAIAGNMIVRGEY